MSNRDFKCLILTAEKEASARSDDYGRDLSSVQLLLTKQEAFDAGLSAFEQEGIQRITELKDQLVAARHAQTPAIQQRHANVVGRWQKLLNYSQVAILLLHGKCTHKILFSKGASSETARDARSVQTDRGALLDFRQKGVRLQLLVRERRGGLD